MYLLLVCVYVWSTSVTHPQAQQQLARPEGGSEKEQVSEPKPIHNNSSFAATAANKQRATSNNNKNNIDGGGDNDDNGYDDDDDDDQSYN